MSQQRIWSQQEDQALCHLFQVEKIQKWSLVAQRLSQLYKIRGLTGKKCKRRYLTLVPQKDASKLHTSINFTQEAEINRLHDEVGNKWSVISRMMNEQQIRDIQRTDNTIKNFFYSKLRKSLRKVNKSMVDTFGNNKRPIKQTVIYKLVETTDERFKKNPKIEKQFIDMSLRLKTWLYQFLDSRQNISVGEIKQFYEECHYFLNNYKSQDKRQRKYSLNSQESEKTLKNVKLPKLEKISRKKDMLYWDDLQENSIEISIEHSSFEENNQNNKISQQLNLSSSDDVVMILEEAGVLEQQNLIKNKVQEEESQYEIKKNFLNESFQNFRFPLYQSNCLNESLKLFTSS